MPSVVGVLKINSVEGVLNIGDTIQIAPQSTSKVFAGAGSFITGDFPKVVNLISSTNTFDPDVKDSTQDKVGGNSGVVI